MEKENKRDAFIRKLVLDQDHEKAPEGFAGRVMEKLRPAGETTHEPLLGPAAWSAIILGAAALVVTMFFINIPFINNFFSSTGIQNISFNIFNSQFYTSFFKLFRELHIDATAIVILVSAVSLVIIERIISRRRSPQQLMIL
jgi:hypothetical protein